jgi:hypothetical protein
VHFRIPPGGRAPPQFGQLTIVPRSSLLVAPRLAVAQLSAGPAVFLGTGAGVFEVRFLIVDPHAKVGTVIHDGLEGPAVVAAGQLASLEAAAEESLAVIAHRRP